MNDDMNERPMLDSDEDIEGSYSFEQQRKSYNRSGAMRARRYRQNRTRSMVLIAVAAAVLLALWIIAAVAIFRGVLGDDPVLPEDGSDTIGAPAESEEDTVQTETPESAIKWTQLKKPAEDVKTGTLILINSTYRFDPAADKKLAGELVSVNQYKAGGYSVAYNTELLRMDTVSAMNAMFTAFQKETGLGGYSIRKDYTYCTADQQQSWYDSTVIKRGAAEAASYEFKGGESEHEAGRTFDIKVEDGKGGSAPIASSDEAYKWIYSNCWKYGIIYRYPTDKTQATGVSMASDSIHHDHFRYVGKAAAAAMNANNWCLEEFLAAIQECRYNGEQMKVTDADGQNYLMYYFPAQKSGDTTVMVPESLPYEISGDNMGGYIITVSVTE